MLSPFLKEAAQSSVVRSEKFMFHMAVMRWKVGALAPEELDALRAWIHEQQNSKNVVPWSLEADKYGDSLLAENSGIQRYVI